MYIKLQRKRPCGNALSGTLFINRERVCDTLENNARKILAGFYPVRATLSPHFGEVMPLIDRVLGRSGIRIHPGNRAEQSEGCVLVGTQYGNELRDSRVAYQQVREAILQALHRREEVWIDIREPKNPTDQGYDNATERGIDPSFGAYKVVYIYDDKTEEIE